MRTIFKVVIGVVAVVVGYKVYKTYVSKPPNRVLGADAIPAIPGGAPS